MTLTFKIGVEYYVVWFLNRVYAQGSREMCCEIYNRFVPLDKQVR